jgi:hypothetical protein
MSNTQLNGKANPAAAERYCVRISPAGVRRIVRSYMFKEGGGCLIHHGTNISCEGDEVFASCMARRLVLASLLA